MSTASWASVWLLIITSCGGSARDPAYEEDQAAAANDGAADTCKEVRGHARDLIDDALLAAPRFCYTDDECQLFRVYQNCAFPCGLEAAVTVATGIQRALETVNGLCRDECREPPPSCGGGYDVEPTARCRSGRCTVVAGR